MNKFKVYLYGALASLFAVLGILLLGKSRKVRELSTLLKIKQIDESVANLQRDVDDKRQGALDAEQKMRDAINSYNNDGKWHPGDSGPSA